MPDAMRNRTAVSAPQATRNSETLVWISLAAFGIFFYSQRLLTGGTGLVNQHALATLATGLLDGVASPIWNYEYRYAPGTVVFGVLLYPVYAAFGSSVLWVRAISIFFVAGGVILWTKALRRAWGFAPAAIFLAWAIAPPPFFELNYHYAYSLHIENVFFSGALLFLFVRMPDAGPRFFETLIFGVIAGFATWFSPLNLPLLPAFAATAIWRWRWRGVCRLIWPAACGCWFGHSPAHYGRWGFYPGVKALVEKTASLDVFSHWRSLLFRDLPLCAGYGHGADSIFGIWLSVAFFLLAALGIAVAVARVVREAGAAGRDWASAFIAFHLLFFVFAFGFSDQLIDDYWSYDWNAHYLATLFFPLLAGASHIIAGASRVRKLAPYVLLAPFLFAGFAHLVSPDNFRPRDLRTRLAGLLRQRGDDYREYVHGHLPDSWASEGAALSSIAKLPRRWRGEGFISFGIHRPPEEIAALATGGALPEADRQRIALGAGIANAGKYFAGPADREPGAAGDGWPAALRLAEWDKKSARSFVEGQGRGAESGKLTAPGVPVGARDVREDAERYARVLRAALPQLDERELLAALLSGRAFWAGYRIFLNPCAEDGDVSDARIGRWLSIVVQMCDDGDGRRLLPECRRQFVAGMASGIKVWLHRFTLAGSLIDPAELRDAFAEDGIRLESCGGGEFRLLIDK
jgi:hypothetical protein